MGMMAKEIGAAESDYRTRRALRLLEPLGMGRVLGTLKDSGALSRCALSSDAPPDAHDRAQRALETGRAVIESIGSEAPPKPLGSDEVMGLEAVVVAVGRPALLIRSGHFDPPPEPWSVLEPRRANIEARFGSVGRIEVRGHPSLDWVGTGFLVAPGVLATNRHVAQEFAQPRAQGHWTIDPGMTVRVDFGEEIDTQVAREHAIRSVIGVHQTLDVALLEVVTSAGDPVPALPLDGGGVPLDRGRLSYVVGYPALDSRRNDPAIMASIFANIYNVKRLQPGLLTDWSAQLGAYLHDCSTLGGNSGSCLIDLESGVVVGIHFGGRFGENNWAVSTRDLAGDGYMQALGAQFV